MYKARYVYGYLLGLAVILGHLGVWYDWIDRKNDLEHAFRTQVQKATENGRRSYRYFVFESARHAQFISELPLIARFLSAGTQEPQIASLLLRFSDRFARYHQVRLLDPQGKERLRILRDSVDTSAELIADLQDKSQRDYFQRAQGLVEGQVLITQVTPNIEKGQIEIPVRPTARLVAPVDLDGVRRGYLVLNINVGPVLQSIFTRLTQPLVPESVIMSTRSMPAWVWIPGSEWEWSQSSTYEPAGSDSSGDVKIFKGVLDPATEAQLTNELDTLAVIDSRVARSLVAEFAEDATVTARVPLGEWEAYYKRILWPDTVMRYFVIMGRSLLLGVVIAFLTLQYQSARARQTQRAASKREESERDHLTGLAQRAGFEREFERRKRASSSTRSVLCVVDIDHFKQVNDTLGHSEGDRVLAEFGRVLSAELRDTDLIARWGGEEFVILLSDVTLEVAASIAERYRTLVEQHIFLSRFNQAIAVTMSVGIADVVEADLGDAFDRADAALYRAKSSGRNRVFADRQATAEPSLRLGMRLPNFVVETDKGRFSLHEYQGDSWLILLSHPKDFTPVCTTELAEAARLSPEWESRNTRLLGLSTDPVEEHRDWLSNVQDLAQCSVTFPLIADTDLILSKALNMLPAEAYLPMGATVQEAKTVRGVFILSPDKRIRMIMIYPMAIGRDFSEIIRILDVLQGDYRELRSLA
ncbi:diguanylate cyclase [Aequoribacter sp.]|uniref:diguanylate cyclase n=1 Tax=Aequoribacter sp. TaxID=2847771 RepID=UPI003F6A1F84